jgi:hypothetical protein
LIANLNASLLGSQPRSYYENLSIAAYTTANSAYNTANAGYNVANLAFNAANNAYSYASSTANNAYITANSAWNTANTANGTANIALSVAQSGYNTANAGYNVANLSYATANAAYNVANLSFVVANSAWSQANNALPNTGSVITVNSNSVLVVSNTTQSTSNTTGALVVNGGVGIGGNTVISGQVSLGGNLGSESLRVLSGNTNGWLEIFGGYGGITRSSIRSSVSGGAGFNILNGSANPIWFGTNATTLASSPSIQFQIAHTTGSVNYLQATGSATGSGPTLSAQGNDAAVDINIVSKSTGNTYIKSGSGTQFKINDTYGAGGTSANYFSVYGRQAGADPIFAAEGSDTNINPIFAAKAGSFSFRTTNITSGTQFQITHTAGAVNYHTVTGSVAANTPIHSVAGTDSNIAWAAVSKGTGGIDLAPGSAGVNISNGGTVTAVTVSNGGTTAYTSHPTPAITAPTTPGGVQAVATANLYYYSPLATTTIVSGGTGYTLNDVITVSGGTFTAAATFTVTGVTGGVVNAITALAGGTYSAIPTGTLSVTGGTGSGFTLTINGWAVRSLNITTAGSGYLEQPTITFSGGGGSGAAAYATVGSNTKIQSLGSFMSFFTPGGEQFRVTDTVGTSSAYWSAQGGGTAPTLLGVGSASAVIQTQNAVPIQFKTSSAGPEQFRVAHTASAVNYVQVTGGATGNGPVISAQGSDTNIAFNITAKGNGAINLSGGLGRALRLDTTAANANFLGIFGTGPGVNPVLSAAIQSTDTNLGINYVTKGTGSHIFQTGNTAATQLQVIDTPGAVNYHTLTGANISNTPVHSVAGTDNNISMAFIAKGNGAFDIQSANGVVLSSGNTVTALTRNPQGAGYTSQVTWTASQPTTPGGTAASGTWNLSLSSVPTIVSGGTGYSVGDVLTIVGGTSVFPAIVTVSSNNAGVITGLTNANTGNYTVAPSNPVTVTGGTGSSATMNISFGLSGTAYSFTSSGSGYIEQPTITLSGGGGTNAGAYALVGSGTKIQSLGSTMSFFTPGGEALRLNDPSSLQSTNYFNLTSGTSTANPIMGVNGSATNIPFNIQSKGTSAVVLYTGASPSQQMQISHTASAVNYVQVTGAATGGAPTLSAQGSDSSINFVLSAKGTGAVQSTSAFRAGTSGANYCALAGAASGSSPTYNAQGSDTNVGLNLQTKGNGAISLITGTYSNTQFQVVDTANAVNYHTMTGSATGNTVIHSVAGTDANTSMAFIAKGNGAFDIQSGNGVNISSGNTVTAISRLNAGIGYTSVPTITISAPTTPGGVTATATAQMAVSGTGYSIASGGTGYTNNDILTVVGGTGTAAQFTVSSNNAGVITGVNLTTAGNYTVLPTSPVSVTGGTGNSATFNLTGYNLSAIGAGLITNAGSGYVEQPTVTLTGGGASSNGSAFAVVGGATKVQSLGSTMSFYTPGGEALRLTDAGNTTQQQSYLQIYPSAAYVYQYAQGNQTNIGLDFVSKGTGSIIFSTNSTVTTYQFYITHTASAVNYVQVTGGATGTSNYPTISAQGSDANINLALAPKGSGAVSIWSGGIPGTGNARFRVNSDGSNDLGISASSGIGFKVFTTTNQVNYLSATGSISGANSVSLTSNGTDTNINLALTPKGTGAVTTTATLQAGLISGGTF